MKTDIQIAQEATPRSITQIAAKLRIGLSIEQYGSYKAKLNPIEFQPRAKLILVTAINPTPLGEGKTTVSIGLADALRKLGKRSVLALREPSLGPVFGIKGGACGGGYAQVLPMEDINLHFTGDLHAITAANNLLCALIDNHIHWGNDQKIKTVTFRRCQDVNDRALRNTVVGLGGVTNGVPREDGFDITAASEVMATLCLATDLTDLKERLGNIAVGLRADGSYVFARDLQANEAMTILLKEAIKPNLVQTLEGTPAIIHGGPFANIAHGCNSVIATRAALTLSDYAITEAGFGADLGAEKFFDIKCRTAGFNPSAVVVVATIKALKYNGGVPKSQLTEENIDALQNGMTNLLKHIDNIRNVFNLPCVVALNRYAHDTDAEIAFLEEAVRAAGADIALTEVWAKGGEGGIALAKAVLAAADKGGELSFAYELEDTIENKITQIARRVYGAGAVSFTDKARKDIAALTNAGFGELPVCIAKTQYSLSDNPSLLGCPSGFTLNVREVKLRAGAGFAVAIAGDMLLMPGLPVTPNSEAMTIDEDGTIHNLS